MRTAVEITTAHEQDTRRGGIRAGATGLAHDVFEGLTRNPKELSPKHLYDPRGCELFEAICGLPEYYPTRTERLILAREAANIVELSDARELVEIGAGSAAKTRVLLDAMRDTGRLKRYVPFDIADAAVRLTAEAILGEYPELESVQGVVGDFTVDLDLIPPPESGSARLVVLLGSTIGNLVGAERRGLLRGIVRLLGPQDRFLIGVDLVKDPDVLEAAYNDSRGVTAAFNQNILAVINRELDGDIPVNNFSHVARFLPEHQWIEMRLRALDECSVRLNAIGLNVHFAAGEEMRTEISAKFTEQRLREDLAGAGLALEHLFTDPDDLFAVGLVRVGGSRQ
jgi:L-histidine N-alpha-methyltransferase